MEWISVKDQVPKDDETVLAIAEGPDSTSSPVLCYFEQLDNNFLSIYDTHSIPLKVTHWSPLPNFKKEDSS